MADREGVDVTNDAADMPPDVRPLHDLGVAVSPAEHADVFGLAEMWTEALTEHPLMGGLLIDFGDTLLLVRDHLNDRNRRAVLDQAWRFCTQLDHGPWNDLPRGNRTLVIEILPDGSDRFDPLTG